MLEARFASVWVEGEVTNLSRPRSGHLYFSLTAPDACLPSVMFRSQAERAKFELKEGMVVRARGRLSIFDAQGKFQLYVEALEPAGVGAQQLLFEALKAKLFAEGLFDPGRKRPLPTWPRRIGVCTSPTGAVVRDIVHVADRRGRVRILIAPCQVQGPSAPQELRAALALLQTIPDVDVIIVARGGGSAEDLAAFNDEGLARAIHACRVPVVSAVGHEVDFSIADFVADVRAPTPSAAAELVTPQWSHLSTRLREARTRLVRAGAHLIADGRLALDDALARGGRVVAQRLVRDRRALEEQRRRLAALHPRARLGADRARLEALRARLHTAGRSTLTQRRRSLEATAGTLHALSPLRVLDRGYAIARAGGQVIRNSDGVATGAQIEVLLSRGALDCRVESTRAPASAEGGEGKGRRST
jgi:exodeoxyribonuclease VII large subunit